MVHRGVFRDSYTLLFSELDVLLVMLFVVQLALDLVFAGVRNLWPYLSVASPLLALFCVTFSPMNRYLGVLCMGAVYLFLHVKLLVNAFTSPRYVIFLGARPSFEKGAEILALALLLLVVMMLFSRSLRGVFKRYLK